MSVRTSIDIASLSAALQRPGIDPRAWVVWAVVLDIAYDAKHGMFADIKLLATGDIETMHIGSDYAGDDYGDYPTLDKDDVVLVAMPEGDAGNGAVFIKRVWSGSHKPPAEFKNASSQEPTDPTEDRTIVVKPGHALRVVARDGATINFEISGTGSFNVKATGSANINIEAAGTVKVESPNVMLGETPGSSVARVGDIGIGSALGVIVPPSLVPLPVLPVPAAPGFVPVTVQLISGADSVKA